jgi:hypothetical protein
MTNHSKGRKKVRRSKLVLLLLLNLLLAGALTAAVKYPSLFMQPQNNCCQFQGPIPYCCVRCCYFIDNCETNGDCLP